MIKITAKKDGFRRCGIAHSSQPTEYPADKFNAEEMKQLNAEPMLIVEIVAVLEETKAPTAQELIELIGKVETLEALEELITDDERRTTVLGAAEKRRVGLTEE